MKIIKYMFAFSLFTFSISFAQDEKPEAKVDKKIEVNKPNSTQAIGDSVSIKSGNKLLMSVTEETTAGAIKLLDAGTVSNTANKLYNYGNSLYWNGSALGTIGGVTKIDDLTDAKTDGTSLFLGNGAGVNNDGSVNENTAVGNNALNMNTTGAYNTATGSGALESNTTGSDNTANGTRALFANTSGNNNTANGEFALYLNKVGSNGVAIGYASQRYANSTTTTHNNYNTSVGYQSLRGSTNAANNTGNNNTAVGYETLLNNSTGNNNVADGNSALRSNLTGSGNIAIGISALYSNITGSGNIAIGFDAGRNATGSNQLYIENSSSSMPLIGGDFDADEIYLNGKVGIGTTNPLSSLSVGGNGNSSATISGEATTGWGIYGQTISGFGVHGKADGVNGRAVAGYSNGVNGRGIYGYSPTTGWAGYFDGNVYVSGSITEVSDLRFKKNITPIKNVLYSLSQIEGFTYNWKTEEFPERNFSNDKLQVGVIAQDLEKVFPNLVVTDNEGFKSVDYIKLSVITMQAVNEQQKIIKELQKEVMELKREIGGKRFTKN